MIGVTDPGVRRNNNEDAYLVVPEIGLAVLADGMGGHLAGEVASGIAVDIVRRNLIGAFARGDDENDCDALERRSLRQAIELANSAIHEAAATRPECAGMGATVVATILFGDKICIAHVGDSRVYRLRSGRLEQITQDHSMIQELVRRGFISQEEARQSVNRNVVTRALGVEAQVNVDIGEHDVVADDLYLLCSDGLSDVLTDEVILEILQAQQGDWEGALRQLVMQVNACGGPDNVSVVLVHADPPFTRNRQAVQQLEQLIN